jgi:hypothetical protein
MSSQRLIYLLVMAGCLLCPGVSRAQEGAPDCRAADLDVSFRFLNSPPNETVVVNFENTSQRACALRPGAGVSFGDSRQGHAINITDCRNCDADKKPKSMHAITLAPAETAHMIVSWETSRVHDSIACQEGGTLNSFGFNIWAGSLLGDVCSVVRVDSFYPGAFAAPKEEPGTVGAAQKPSSAAIKLTPSADVFYADDTFWLYAEVSDPDATLPLDEHSCPTLYLKTRASDGTTSFQDAGGWCHPAENKESLGRLIQTTIWTMSRGPFASAETRVEVFALTNASRAPEVQMVRSNAIVLRRADPLTLERMWGPQSKGLGVSLVLDKQDYRVGEDIALRLAVENFSAVDKIYSGELPCSAGLTFEVRDSNGQTVTSPGTSICTGHGWWQDYPLGKAVRILGLTLSGAGRLPDRPGLYTVVATWQPFAGNPMAASNSAPLVPYAMVKSLPVTFRVMADK